MRIRPSSSDRGWLLPIAAAVALRGALFAFASPHPERFTIESDSGEYMTLARNLARGYGFSLADRPPYEPDVRRTPVYPSVLAGVAWMHEDPRLFALVSLVASVAAVAAACALGDRLFGAAAGTLAGWMLALDITSAAYATQVLTEALFALLLALALLAAVDVRTTDARTGIMAGALTGLAALCRPIGVYLAAALLPACRWRAGPSTRRTATTLLLAITVSGAIVGAWTLRNARVSGTATFTTQAATNAYFHRAAYVAAALEHRRVELIRDEWTAEFERASGTWTEAQRVAWMNDHGRALVFAHPFVYAWVFARGLARMFGPDRDVLPALVGVGRASPAWRMIAAISWTQLLLVYAAALAGTWSAIRRSPGAALIPLFVIAYFLVVAGPEMYARFRVPVMVPIALLAGNVGWKTSPALARRT